MFVRPSAIQSGDTPTTVCGNFETRLRRSRRPLRQRAPQMCLKKLTRRPPEQSQKWTLPKFLHRRDPKAAREHEHQKLDGRRSSRPHRVPLLLALNTGCVRTGKVSGAAKPLAFSAGPNFSEQTDMDRLLQKVGQGKKKTLPTTKTDEDATTRSRERNNLKRGKRRVWIMWKLQWSN